MKREEEIEKSVYDYSKKIEERMNSFDYFNYEHIEHAFIDGIEWADANPKNPWISVEDDLPCNHEELVTTDGHYEKNTICVITINKYGIIEGNYMVLYDDGKWEWRFGVPAPCYWMLIPKLPKESEIELTVY